MIKKVINNSWGKNKGNHYHVGDGGFICDEKFICSFLHKLELWFSQNRQRS